MHVLACRNISSFISAPLILLIEWKFWETFHILLELVFNKQNEIALCVFFNEKLTRYYCFSKENVITFP